MSPNRVTATPDQWASLIVHQFHAPRDQEGPTVTSIGTASTMLLVWIVGLVATLAVSAIDDRGNLIRNGQGIDKADAAIQNVIDLLAP